MAARLGRAPALEKRDGRDPVLYTGTTGSIPAEGSRSLAPGCPTRNERLRVRFPLGPPFWTYSRMVKALVLSDDQRLPNSSEQTFLDSDRVRLRNES
jgi:hypothetical protein